MTERRDGVQESVVRSKTLEDLLPRLYPGAAITIRTGRTDYAIRVQNHQIDQDGMATIRATVLEPVKGLAQGEQVTISVPVREPQGQARMWRVADGQFAVQTSAISEFFLGEAPPREAKASEAAPDLRGYEKGAWSERFASEKPDPLRGMKAVIQILPDYIEQLAITARSLEDMPPMADMKNQEAYAAEARRRREQAQAILQNDIPWLQAAQQLAQHMVAGNVMVRWDMAAGQMGLNPEQAQYALKFLAYHLRPGMNDRIGAPENHFQSLRGPARISPEKNPRKYEEEAQRLLGLRDAKGLLKAFAEHLK